MDTLDLDPDEASVNITSVSDASSDDRRNLRQFKGQATGILVEFEVIYRLFVIFEEADNATSVIVDTLETSLSDGSFGTVLVEKAASLGAETIAPGGSTNITIPTVLVSRSEPVAVTTTAPPSAAPTTAPPTTTPTEAPTVDPTETTGEESFDRQVLTGILAVSAVAVIVLGFFVVRFQRDKKTKGLKITESDKGPALDDDINMDFVIDADGGGVPQEGDDPMKSNRSGLTSPVTARTPRFYSFQKAAESTDTDFEPKGDFLNMDIVYPEKEMQSEFNHTSQLSPGGSVCTETRD